MAYTPKKKEKKSEPEQPGKVDHAAVRAARIAKAREKASAVEEKGDKGPKKRKGSRKNVGPPEGGWDDKPFGTHKNDRMINSIIVFGESGSGKTTIAGAVPGAKVAIGFDNKTDVIAEKFRKLFPKEEFLVLNGARYYPPDVDDDEICEAGHRTYEYILHLIKTRVKGKGFKWGIIDSTDIFIKAMEMGMRHEKDFGPFSPMGKDNFAAWGVRNRMIKKVLTALADAVEHGIVITAYYLFDTSIATEMKAPSWPNQLREMCKVELHAWKDVERHKGNITIDHVAENMQTKNEDYLRTGDVYDMHTPDLRNQIAAYVGEKQVKKWFKQEDEE